MSAAWKFLHAAPPHYTSLKLRPSEIITIDGHLDDVAWSAPGVEWTTPLVDITHHAESAENVVPAEFQARAKLRWSEAYLYVGIELREKKGLLWPGQYQESNKRWGVNLSKPCRKIVGITPKGFRDRVATILRENNMNEAVVVSLLGHTPNSISMAYGATPWSELKRAVKLL